MPSALEGVKVIENCTAFAGPFCCMVLGDLGAEVIKVESTQPPAMDYVRVHGEWVKVDGEERIVSYLFPTLNRNKRSITLNLRTPKGVKILKDLVRTTDVFVENRTPGAMQRLGIDYEALRQVNPSVIYCSISGYGQTGPDSFKKAFDITIQGMSGLASMTGPPGTPTRVGNSMSDWAAGLYGAIGILAALNHRNKTGRGQYIDISLFESMVTLLDCSIESYYMYGKVDVRSRLLPAYGIFMCRDRPVIMAAHRDEQWKDLCKVMGKEGYITDPRTKDDSTRLNNRDFTNQIVSDWATSKTSEEVLKALTEVNVPCAPIRTIEEVGEDPQLRHREMFVPYYHPILKRMVKMVGSPLKMSETPTEVKRRYPELGEHTEEILTDILKYSKEDIEKLRKEGVLR